MITVGNFEIETSSKIGRVTSVTSRKNYQESPGDFTTAAQYAYSQVKKQKLPALIFPGNSYGHKVFFIALVSESPHYIKTIRTHFNALNPNVAYIDMRGDVYQATIHKAKRSFVSYTQRAQKSV